MISQRFLVGNILMYTSGKNYFTLLKYCNMSDKQTNHLKGILQEPVAEVEGSEENDHEDDAVIDTIIEQLRKDKETLIILFANNKKHLAHLLRLKEKRSKKKAGTSKIGQPYLERKEDQEKDTQEGEEEDAQKESGMETDKEKMGSGAASENDSMLIDANGSYGLSATNADYLEMPDTDGRRLQPQFDDWNIDIQEIANDSNGMKIKRCKKANKRKVKRRVRWTLIKRKWRATLLMKLMPMVHPVCLLRPDSNARKFQPQFDDDLCLEILENAIHCMSNSATTTDLEEVPLWFKSFDDYINIFRPLLLEEFKAQFQSSYSKLSTTSSITISPDPRVGDDHHVTFYADSKDVIRKNDLVLITTSARGDYLHAYDVIGMVERVDHPTHLKQCLSIICPLSLIKDKELQINHKLNLRIIMSMSI